MRQELLITAFWDEDASVWVATSDDVPGLAIEAATQSALLERLKVVIPELLDENGYEDGPEVPFRLATEQRAVAYRAHV